MTFTECYLTEGRLGPQKCVKFLNTVIIAKTFVWLAFRVISSRRSKSCEVIQD